MTSNGVSSWLLELPGLSEVPATVVPVEFQRRIGAVTIIRILKTKYVEDWTMFTWCFLCFWLWFN